MRVLVVYGSKHGGTAGLAEMIGDALGKRGVDVQVRAAREVHEIRHADAVIVGGSLYAFRWHRDARRFVRRHRRELSLLPVFFFSSGPLDDSAAKGDIPPVGGVVKAMSMVEGRGHMTFGGRLEPDVKGFPASAMAKKNSGDWRDPAQVERWVDEILVGLGRRSPTTH
jgi:menaquinone-dependent protoporphyrinogen oxidase